MESNVSQSWVWWNSIKTMARFEYFQKWKSTLPITSRFKNYSYPMFAESRKGIELLYQWLNKDK